MRFFKTRNRFSNLSCTECFPLLIFKVQINTLYESLTVESSLLSALIPKCFLKYLQNHDGKIQFAQAQQLNRIIDFQRSKI